MAACEFLHASVIFLTGTNSRRTEELRLRYPLAPLYAKIFPVILNLAADSDEIIRQLFHALLIQVKTYKLSLITLPVEFAINILMYCS